MLNFITRIPKPENNPEIEIKTYINRPRSHSDIYKHLEKNKKKISAYETSRKRKVEDESEQKIRNKNKFPRVDIASKRSLPPEILMPLSSKLVPRAPVNFIHPWLVLITTEVQHLTSQRRTVP